MAMLREVEFPAYTRAESPRTSWAAIVAGALISVALTGCLGLLGLALGFVHVPMGGILQGLSMRAAGWMIVTGAIAFYVGGWVASRLAGTGRLSDSIMHGLASWAAATVAALLMFVTVGAVFSPTAIALSPAAAATFGWYGFLMTALESAATCIGARNGARLLRPVPIEEYHKAEKREPVGL